MLKIYHNPRCRKSRAGLQYLEEKGLPFEVIDYLKNPLAFDEMKLLFQKLHTNPQSMIRTQEAKYKSDFKGKNFSDDEWIMILMENPKLLHRPIVEFKHKAVFAQPPEEIDKLI